MGRKSLSVPGNLLLLGEFAVLEPGGLGFAVAPDIRTTVTIGPFDKLEVEGRFGEESMRWSPENPDTHLLFSEIFARCDALTTFRSLSSYPVRIVVDSSTFYSKEGKKLGYGSSAAVSVALSAAFLGLLGFQKDRIEEESLRIALSSHRAVQNGVGSGYDIFTSVHGAAGLFTGGALPAWEAVRPPWLPELYLFTGTGPVSTGNAAARYNEWKKQQPEEAERFKEESNRSVLSFLGAASWEEAKPHFLRSREIGLELGENIGLSASIVPPTAALPFGSGMFGAGLSETGIPGTGFLGTGFLGTTPDIPYKAIGAGNELGVLLTERGDVDGSASGPFARLSTNGLIRKVSIAEEGIRWNQTE
jgi:phosphomevalonate kinase